MIMRDTTTRKMFYIKVRVDDDEIYHASGVLQHKVIQHHQNVGLILEDRGECELYDRLL